MERLERISPQLDDGNMRLVMNSVEESDIDIELVSDAQGEADHVEDLERQCLPLKEGEYQYVISSRQATPILQDAVTNHDQPLAECSLSMFASASYLPGIVPGFTFNSVKLPFGKSTGIESNCATITCVLKLGLRAWMDCLALHRDLQGES